MTNSAKNRGAELKWMLIQARKSLLIGMFCVMQFLPVESVAIENVLSSIDPVSIGGKEKVESTEPDELTFKIGDKLKITIFEQIENDEEKWGTKNRAPLRNFVIRTEMSGDYLVQSDGTITIPMLGAFPVASRKATDFSSECGGAFQRALGRPAVVNISLIERMPISVVGPVKQPGVYAFAQGMTVLHAIARAGGFEDGPKDSWSRVEVSREKGKAELSNESLKKLLAEASVLHAEREHRQATVEQLTTFAPPDEARKLLNAAIERRRLKTRAEDDRRTTLVASIDSAKKAIELSRARIAPLEQALSLKKERLSALKKLVDHGSIARPTFIQAQGEASEAEDKKLSTQNMIVEAEQRLTLLKNELARFESEIASDLEQQITRLDREISEITAGLSASAGVLSALKSNVSMQKIDRSALSYTVVRPNITGPRILPADEYFQLQPGDLVRIDVNVAGR